jgi:spartin
MRCTNEIADPVEITLPEDGSQNIAVAPASPEYLETAMHPAYKSSRIVSKAAAASRLIVTTSGYVGQALQSQADGFTQRTQPTQKPITFNPTTHARIRKIHTFSEGAAGLSAKTVGQVQKYAQNIGASIVRRSESQKAVKGISPDGQPIENYKPGLLNKSLMAFSTVADGVDQAARNLLASTGAAATTVVGHKFGPEAGEVSRNLTGGFKNVGLVYIDATGVSRRAIIKSVAKGMVVGRVRGTGDLVVGGGDGGQVFTASPENWKEKEALEGRYTDDPYMSGGRESPSIVGFGRATPSYASGVGESIEGQRISGKWS